MTTIYYGIAIPVSAEKTNSDTDLKPSYTEKSEVLKVLKEFKTARFKGFKSEQEAEAFSKLSVVSPVIPAPSPALNLLSSPKPSEKCEFKSLKPQEEVKFRKAIESNPSDLDFLVSCIEENARYLVTPSDTPTILQHGQRHNALHVAARHGKVDAAKMVLSHVTGDIMTRMYPEEDRDQNFRRREYLVDMYLNMPDKGGGDTPLHLASKWGHLEIVRLLCSYNQTRLEQGNKFGEFASQVVCSRAKSQENTQAIKEILAGQVVIPVYSSDDSKHLGKPISLKEASDLLETSFNDISQTNLSLTSTSNLSPLVQSTRARVNHRGLSGSPLASASRSPLTSSATRSPITTSLSAVMGPLTSSQAKSLYRKWRTGSDSDMDMARQRLEDPILGVERQGRNIATKEGVTWMEYWPWLGEYLDLSSEEGLKILNDYLEDKTRKIRVRLEREYQEEIDDEFEASIAVKSDSVEDNVFSGELELISSSTPAKSQTISSSSSQGSNWTSYRTSSEDDSVNEDLDNSDNFISTTDKNGNNTKNVPEPLSPLSSLTNGFGSLKIASKADVKNQIDSEFNSNTNLILTTPPTKLQHSLSNDVMMTLEQFASSLVTILADSAPEQVPADILDSGDLDWVTPMITHWSHLRRQVNNWKSDPGSRWAGIDWNNAALTLIEMISEQVTIELGAGLERERLGHVLARLGQADIANNDHHDDDSDISDDGESYGRGRRRLSSTSSSNGVRDISLLCSFVSKMLLDSKMVLDPMECGAIWNLPTEKFCVNTKNVNRARKFLHSGSMSSDFSSESHHQMNEFSQWSFSVDNRNEISQSNHQINLVEEKFDSMNGRRDSISSQEDLEWLTPPCSPGASSVASMETCSEGIEVWLMGDGPTIQDRRVEEALKHVPQSTLTRYTHVAMYLAHVGSYSRATQLTWPDISRVTPSDNDRFGGLVRKLDLDFTI